jgi:NhaA family Na+:H+ antiporter
MGGVIAWYFMLQSGVHATVSGILLAFVIPFQNGKESSISCKLQRFLHKPVAFLILPLFALANTSVIIESDWAQALTGQGSIGIFVGLILGKPIGVFLFSFIAVTIGICTLPEGMKWKNILGIGFLGGIGFTMSIFITLLAFESPELITQSKIAVLLASIISGVIGYSWLKLTFDPPIVS